MNVFPFISDRIGRQGCMVTYWFIIAIGFACETAAHEWKVWVCSQDVDAKCSSFSDGLQNHARSRCRRYAVLAPGLHLRNVTDLQNSRDDAVMLQLLASTGLISSPRAASDPSGGL